METCEGNFGLLADRLIGCFYFCICLIYVDFSFANVYSGEELIRTMRNKSGIFNFVSVRGAVPPPGVGGYDHLEKSFQGQLGGPGGRKVNIQTVGYSLMAHLAAAEPAPL